jgi:hypothetical protein
MKSRIAILAVVSVFSAFVSKPAHLHGQQPAEPQQHEQHHPGTTEPPAPSVGEPQANMMSMMARMKATDPKLDQLVKKMNTAKGSAKTDAIAELLTTLVEDRRTTCEPMMANMMSMMNMMNTMGGRGGHGETTPRTPEK